MARPARGASGAHQREICHLALRATQDTEPLSVQPEHALCDRSVGSLEAVSEDPANGDQYYRRDHRGDGRYGRQAHPVVVCPEEG